MELAPIVLFVYNRPLHTRQTVETLLRNELAGKSELFIFSDGPKNQADAENVSAVRDYIRAVKGFKRTSVIESPNNRGLANSVIAGVTEIVDRCGKIIVLEDDLVLSAQFLHFMNTALAIYKDKEKVMHISGYMFPVKGTLPETFFYRATSCWGWATWKRAWKKFEPDSAKLLSRFEDKKQIRKFNVEGSMNYHKMLRDQSTGRVNSWAIRWYASVFLNHGLCLHPGKSMVNNIGHDDSGIHCCSTNRFDVRINQDRIACFTQEMEENKEALALMADFYRSLRRPLHIRLINKMRTVSSKINTKTIRSNELK